MNNVIISKGNGFSPDRIQAIAWVNEDFLLNGP